MRTISPRRVVTILLLAAVFGVTLSIIKGNDGGARDAVGNLSAPWLLLPFLAGLACRGRAAAGAVVGLAATLMALAGFYVANAFVFELGPHPFTTDIQLAVSSGRMYFIAGLFSGPIFGALGGWWHQHRSTALALLVTSTLIFEPAAQVTYGHVQPGSFDLYPGLWETEVVIGVGACVVIARRMHNPPGSTMAK